MPAEAAQEQSQPFLLSYSETAAQAAHLAPQSRAASVKLARCPRKLGRVGEDRKATVWRGDNVFCSIVVGCRVISLLPHHVPALIKTHHICAGERVLLV